MSDSTLTAPKGRDLHSTFLALGIVFPILAIACVALRFEARRMNRLKPQWDDWTVVLALIFTIGVTINIILSSQLGNLGGHEDPTNPNFLKQVLAFTAANWTMQLIVIPAIMFTKLSVLLFYKRIFQIRKAFRILHWVMVTIVVTSSIAFLFALIFECLPVASNWDPLSYPNPKCVNEKALFTAGLATDVITDGIILFMPIYNVWKLKMPTASKIGVSGIFMLGGLVIVAGIVRLVFLVQAYTALSNPTDDVSYTFSPAIYWTIVELNVGVISACLPTMRPLYQGYKLDSVFSSTKALLTGGRSSTKTATNWTSGSKSRINEEPSKDSIRLHSLEGSTERSEEYGV